MKFFNKLFHSRKQDIKILKCDVGYSIFPNSDATIICDGYNWKHKDEIFSTTSPKCLPSSQKCFNNGNQTVSGNCVCPEGFTGEFCELGL